MAQNPDPQVKLTSLSGQTRTLDDWATTFQLLLVVLPGRPEAKDWIPVGRRIFSVLGDSDVRCAYVVGSTEAITRRIVGDAAERTLVLADPDEALAESLQLERLPAIVHLRQDTTLVAAAQGWSTSEWQKVVTQAAKAVRWSVPEVSGRDNPPPTPGWPRR